MKKVYLALTERHLDSIHKGLEGKEKEAQLGARDSKMYERANNVCFKQIQSRVKFLQTFTLFFGESE